MLHRVVKSYGYRGKGYSARNNWIIKGMKAVHLLAALAWGGGALSMQALNYLRIALDEPEMGAQIARCAHFIDSCVVMPGLAGCLVTGLFYSICTSIGFFRYAWIGYKWLVSLSAGFWGTLFWGPWGGELIEFCRPYGLDGLLKIARGFILPENMWQGALQTCIILSMCMISVYRPLSFRPSFMRVWQRLIRRRLKAVYEYEKSLAKRCALDNSQVKALYEDWLGQPLSEKARQHLHAKKQDRSAGLEALRKAGLYPRPTLLEQEERSNSGKKKK